MDLEPLPLFLWVTGLFVVTLVVTVLVGLVAGGFKVGSLERTLEVVVPTAELAAFLERAWARLAELGFQQTEQPWEFTQGGKSIADGFATSMETAGSTPHAKSRKHLRVTVLQDADAARVQITMKFLGFITGDSGESAYRDAVLDYVTGQKQAMSTVRNQSAQAVSALANGIVLLCAAPIMLPRLGLVMTLVLILLLAATNLFFAVVAIVSISRNPQELRGTGYAISGIVLTVVGVILTIALGLFGL